MLTPSTEWQVSASDNNAISSSNISVKPQSYVGSNNVVPIVVGNSILFSQSRGCRIREMAYSWQTQAYQSNDISVMAAHLFDYSNVVDMAFSKAPYQILHCVSSNGTLASLTYVPEQQVAAWHHHDFGGFVESICVITEQPAGTVASEDMLYLVVNFKWQGTTLTCTIPTHGATAGQSKYFSFSDTTLSGQYTIATVADVNTLTLTVAATGQEIGTVAMTAAYQVSTISGLTWLPGMTVNILADGAPMPQQVVSLTGTLSLPYPATKVIVGLPITTQVQTLPASLQTDAGFAETLQKNVDQVWLRMFRTSGVYVGPDASNLVYATQRANTDLPGNPPALFTGVLPVVIQPEWNFDGTIFIQQTDPLPMTICALATDTTVR
jgi:hypothetical protein